MAEVANFDPKMLYFIGVLVILLILIMVSFVLTSRRTGRLEQDLDELSQRVLQFDQTLNKLQQSVSSLAASQSASVHDDDDVALQAITDLSSKFTKMSADFNAALSEQSSLRQEIDQLKNQIEQNSFVSDNQVHTLDASQVNHVIQGGQYPSSYEDSSLSNLSNQSMLPPTAMQGQRNFNASSAMQAQDPYASGMMGQGMMSRMEQGRGGMPNMNGQMNQGFNNLPSGNQNMNTSRRANAMGSTDDSGIFMPPRTAASNNQYNPSEKTGLQGMVENGASASSVTAESSRQSQVEQRSSATGFTPDDEGFNSSKSKSSNSSNEIKLPSMSIVAEVSLDPIDGGIEPAAIQPKNKGVGSGVVEVDPNRHAIAKKLDPALALNSQQAEAKAREANASSSNSSPLDSVDPASKLSLHEEAVLAAINSVDDSVLFGGSRSKLDEQGLNTQDLGAQNLDDSNLDDSVLSSSSLTSSDRALNSLGASDLSSQAFDTERFKEPNSTRDLTAEALSSSESSFGRKHFDHKDFEQDSTSSDLSKVEPTPRDDERFAALDNFTNLYTNARKKQLAREKLEAGHNSVNLEQDDNSRRNSALRDLNAAENSITSVKPDEGSTIDFGQDMHFGKMQPLERTLSQASDRTRTEAVAKAVADSSKQRQPPMPEVMSPGVLQKATVVDMIYDEEYVRKQKDQKPYGINIDTLDKAHTFIDAGVPLVEISAKTGLSEDELRLLYDVDEDGKVRNSGEMFKENSALGIMQGEQSDQSTQEKFGDKTSTQSSTKKAFDKKSDSALSPSAVLDKDERKEIESIMKDMPSSGTTTSSDDAVNLATSEKSVDKRELSFESSKNKSDLTLENEALGTDSKSSTSKGFEKPAVHKKYIEQIKDDEFEQNLDAIDQFADSLIQENRQKEQERKLSKDNSRKSASLKANTLGKSSLKRSGSGVSSNNKLAEETTGNTKIIGRNAPTTVIMPSDLDEPKFSTSQDPLNIMDDFKGRKNKLDAYQGTARSVNREPSGTGAENLAANNAAYLEDLNADINAALDDDEVTLRTNKTSKVGSLSQNSSKLNSSDSGRKNASGSNLGLSSGTSSGLKSGNSTNIKSHKPGAVLSTANGKSSASTANAGQVVKHYGRSRSEKKINSVGGVDRESYEQSQSSERYARKAMLPMTGRGQNQDADAPKKITVDMALAQMEGGRSSERRGANSGSSARAPLGLGSVSATTHGGFSSVTAMNPGMSDVVDMAPMGIGSMDDELSEDPAEILNQVVKGGLKSVSDSLTMDQMDVLNQVSNALPETPAIPVEPTRVKPGQHYANRKARNAYGMSRQA